MQKFVHIQFTFGSGWVDRKNRVDLENDYVQLE